MALKQGSVIWANVCDPNGVNRKHRPLLVVSTDPDQAPDKIVCVAITSSFTKPLEAFAVPLPFSQHGHCRSGLKKESIAHCEWLLTVSEADVIECKGWIDGAHLDKVLIKINALSTKPASVESGMGTDPTVP